MDEDEEENGSESKNKWFLDQMEWKGKRKEEDSRFDLEYDLILQHSGKKTYRDDGLFSSPFMSSSKKKEEPLKIEHDDKKVFAPESFLKSEEKEKVQLQIK